MRLGTRRMHHIVVFGHIHKFNEFLLVMAAFYVSFSCVCQKSNGKDAAGRHRTQRLFIWWLNVSCFISVCVWLCVCTGYE